MSLIGKKVENFTLTAFINNDFVELTEQILQDKWSVLFFYPADFTFVCPTELEDLADYYEAFKKIDTEVYSISTDTHFAHKAWHDSSTAVGKIKFPMIADPTHALTKDLESLIVESGLAERATFIINPRGEVAAYEVSAGNVGRNAAELLRKVQALQFVWQYGDNVCPAKWSPGSDTLKPSADLVGKL